MRTQREKDLVRIMALEAGLETIERELRERAQAWREAEELDGRTIRDDFNRVADMVREMRP